MRSIAFYLSTSALLIGSAASAQTFATRDPVLQQIWQLGMEQSQTYRLAQALMDSVGPRLTGSPGHKAGNDWLVKVYQSLGIPARNDQYGTWLSWRRGITHIDLLAPRVRTLEGTMLAWSPGTKGQPVRGDVIILTDAKSPAEFQQWLPQVKSKYVLVSFPEPTCRPDNHWEQNALQETFERMREARQAASTAWNARRDSARTGVSIRELPRQLEQAGALGLISANWSRGWGVEKIFNARTQRVPSVQLSCEDYGLVYRLAENGDAPVLRIAAESEFLGEQPVFNTIAEIKGSEKPNEYVMLSAHFDSWDGSSGATDNGTGTITMLEAMRILKQAYPNPKRTILVGHWGGEEQGLIGSRAFAKDHPEIVQNLQALFNQDNGTGRVVNVTSAGLISAAPHVAKWMAQVPSEITRNITLGFPGTPAGGGSDNASFICHGAPGFGLGSTGFDYGIYTWHTNRDTFDKVVFDDVKNNATLTAMLVYLASEDPERVGRDRRTVMPRNQRGQEGSWPSCTEPQRNSTNYMR